MKPAERLHVRILHDLGDNLPVAEFGHVFEQKKSEDQLGVLGRPACVGKVLEILGLERGAVLFQNALQVPPCMA
jgi:hypothetical protein